jgi:hypothetical protein
MSSTCTSKNIEGRTRQDSEQLCTYVARVQEGPVLGVGVAIYRRTRETSLQQEGVAIVPEVHAARGHLQQ